MMRYVQGLTFCKKLTLWSTGDQIILFLVNFEIFSDYPEFISGDRHMYAITCKASHVTTPKIVGQFSNSHFFK